MLKSRMHRGTVCHWYSVGLKACKELCGGPAHGCSCYMHDSGISVSSLRGRPPVFHTCRAALPALFRQKDAFKLLQPEGFLTSEDSAADQGEGEDLQPQVPRLRENLEAFLADKLQLVDRCAGAAGCELGL